MVGQWDNVVKLMGLSLFTGPSVCRPGMGALAMLPKKQTDKIRGGGVAPTMFSNELRDACFKFTVYAMLILLVKPNFQCSPLFVS